MRYFILAAILFFSYRAFSQTFDYYNIDEYIRAQEDPNYEEYINGIKAEREAFGIGVDEYKYEKEYDAFLQEQTRLDYIDERDKEKIINDPIKIELAYEEEKQRELDEYLLRQEEYESQQAEVIRNKIIRKDPSRMLASLEDPNEKPRKKIPRPERRFKFKAKSNTTSRK